MTLFDRFAAWLITRSERRSPDFIITNAEATVPYLRRWWLIPRNRFLNIYLHHIQRSDDDRALHDHPWWNCSILLRGAYNEITPESPRGQLRYEGDIVFRRARAAHRLELDRHLIPIEFPTPSVKLADLPCWTLFITGPRIREWGFHCPRGWVHWREFTSPTDKGQIGKGCAE